MTQAEPLPEIRAASTLLILRDVGRGPEVLMAERGSDLVFAGGALVFPGGAVDEGDLLHADQLNLRHAREEVAARIAAIRETLEESGLAVGFAQPVEPKVAVAVRAALSAGQDFAATLAEAQLTLDLEALVPFARWLPPFHTKRRFDTRFYVAHLADAMVDISPDGRETARLIWETPATLVAMAEREEAKIIFPTLRNLERIAQFETVGAILEHSRSLPVESVSPWTEERDGVAHLCIPEGLGYPVTAVPITKALRG
jgi:8-oxo-dGTP pyrophosphatase MutT (NUDIX family)